MKTNVDTVPLWVVNLLMTMMQSTTCVNRGSGGRSWSWKSRTNTYLNTYVAPCLDHMYLGKNGVFQAVISGQGASRLGETPEVRQFT